MAPSATLLFLLLLGVLTSASSLPPARISFPLNSTGRPLVHFSLHDVHNTTTLLLSDDGSTLYVGARDAVLSLDISQSDVISLRRKVSWRPSEDDIKECRGKGKNQEVDCPNFVRVLQLINSTHLYTCGSFAFSPRDAFIDTASFSLVQHNGAKGRCPFSPFQRNSAIAIDGELFTATTSDFRGVEPQISRHFSKDSRPNVSQDTSVSLLDEPSFVGSSADPVERKLYFFFSEVGKEFSFVDKLQIPRVAQVCRDDSGGQRTLQKKWTSFAKASLLCQSHKQLPFNILQDMFTLQPPEGGDASDTLFYGVFTSQWSSGRQSAVCVFKLQDVRMVFAGSYRTFDMKTHQWSLQQGKHWYLGQCGLDKATDSELEEVKRSFLTSGGVKPVTDGPAVVSSEHQYSRVAAMRTMAANGKQYTVLFLLTESGFLHKMVFLDRGARLIEEIQVFTHPQLVKSIVLSSTKGAVYVGTSEGVTSVPVANCSVYRSCSQCVLARDPLCGWSPTRRECTSLNHEREHIVQDVENGNVEKECLQQIRNTEDTEVSAGLNEVVRLQCIKPSNMATLTWTSPRFQNLSEKLFIQSTDGSLIFHAADATFGTYHCEAEEGGYKEVVMSYTVQPMVSPRSIIPNDPKDPGYDSEDDSFEEFVPEKQQTVTIGPSGDAEDEDDEFTTNLQDDVTSNSHSPNPKRNIQDDGLNRTLTFRKDSQSLRETLNVPETRYYSELVVVSLLLGICIFILALGGVHQWRQRKADVKRNPCADAGSELEVVETSSLSADGRQKRKTHSSEDFKISSLK
ncbi:semaphorin-4A isoform X1 [Pleuronectes platessa]|uniref:semaphorin-4A isoform X1 n=1 Tax=Pleuronectes platessa TaxID=8262 RepID=UPI00232A1985|nr:semaphorin-4A isoform X1 [Pleuronectes platessa]